MDIAQDIFSGKRPIISKLKAFGFKEQKSSDSVYGRDVLAYTEKIMDGDLTCEVIIHDDSSVKCILRDTDSGDEYAPVNIESYTGSYVGKAREEYTKVLEQIASSCFDYAAPTSRHARYWIIPSNPSFYDVAAGFRNSPDKTISWHHRINVMPGDIVYIYQTEPIAAIRFKTQVVASFLPRPSSWSGFSPSSQYRMDIRLLETYDKDMYPRKLLNEYGIKKTVRGQRSAPPELVELIESHTD